jgi:hypothetical protein
MISDILNPTSFRYERKFLISELNRYEIESIVKFHPAIFSEIHHQRFVNNIYFDTINMSNYFNNVIGISQRLKVRIRWYGDLLGFIEKPVLELKIKKGFLGSKLRFPLDSFYLGCDYSLDAQQDIFAKSGVPDVLTEHLKSLRFALLNRYSRKYFESADHKFRITIDFDMEFYKIDPANNSFIEKIVDHNNTVLELKYSEKDDEEVKFITNYFPFRMTKSSKYVSGIEKLYSYL